jgi:hypothetical protein
MTMARRLVITNGDSAGDAMRAAGIAADILPWRDILHDGPVPKGHSLEALSGIRGRYLAEAFGSPDGVSGQFAARDRTIRNHDQFDRIELWLEHDLVDQLQLIQILDVLSGFGRRDGVCLIQADDYLGTMSADAVRALGSSARPVTLQQFETATRAWNAFTAETPEDVAVVAFNDLPLPYLAGSLRRLLAELPAVDSGLGLTEHRVLAALAAGRRKVGELFAVTQAQEEARFLGDAPFFRRLDGLAFCSHPLVSGLPFRSQRGARGEDAYRSFVQSSIVLTETGRAALAGTFDHARQNGIDRWLGGTHLTAENLWRREPSGGIVAPTVQ